MSLWFEEQTMGNKFSNKVVVVTGGTSGIGLVTAKSFVAEGASVFITGRRQGTLEAAVQAIGGQVTGVQGDMASLADIDRLYDAVQKKHAQIDVVFANAGGGEMVPLGAITEEHYQRTFDNNVKGVLFTVQKALPLLKDGASVILTGSTTSISGTPAFSVYSATKAAVRNFARNWILDLKDRHIRVNAVSPGVTDTVGLNDLFGGGAQAEGTKSYLASLIPAGRVGQPDEIAKAVLFLASDDASFINGIELFVDGGQAQI
jgi:NAD(P)-dependent dehydrogenase (short-subunit alcohol dehydrogenase family)